MWHDSYIQILETNYTKLRQKNPLFSRRAFAKKLGVSVGMLSDVANNKARFTKKRAVEIIERLELTEKERARILVLLGHADQITQEIPVVGKLSAFTDWINRTILFAFDISKFEMTEEYLSKSLGLSLEDVKTRIDNLLELGLLVKDEEGKMSRTKVIWKVPDADSKEFTHELFRSNLELAQKAIKQVPASARDFSTITFAGNSTQLEKVRNEIKALYERVFAVMEDPPMDQVYQMSVFLHPTMSKD